MKNYKSFWTQTCCWSTCKYSMHFIYHIRLVFLHCYNTIDFIGYLECHCLSALLISMLVVPLPISMDREKFYLKTLDVLSDRPLLGYDVNLTDAFILFTNSYWQCIVVRNIIQIFSILHIYSFPYNSFILYIISFVFPSFFFYLLHEYIKYWYIYICVCEHLQWKTLNGNKWF